MFPRNCFLLLFIALFGQIIRSQVTVDNKSITRIVNGRPAVLGEIPYIVSFKRKGRRNVWGNFCGGSILAPTKIITAAHCFEKKKGIIDKLCGPRVAHTTLSTIRAVAGNLRTNAKLARNDSVERGQWRKLKNCTYPHKYKFPKHDICIIFVIKPFVYTEYIKPIAYASHHTDYKGPCIGSGYGRISRQIRSDSLMTADLDPLRVSECNRYFYKNTKSYFCTHNYPSDTAKGDSGGPIVCFKTLDPNETSLGLLVGVVCGGSPKKPSYNTRVSFYHKYVQRNRSCGKVGNFLYHFLSVMVAFLLKLFSAVLMLSYF